MVLGFSTAFPKHHPKKGQPTAFPQKVMDGIKIHTFRGGSRWDSEKRIHMATGTRTKNYVQFNRLRPDLWFCKGTQWFAFAVDKAGQLYLLIKTQKKGYRRFYVNTPGVEEIARNDGFENAQDFFDWFRPPGVLRADYEVHGQIVHWTGFRY